MTQADAEALVAKLFAAWPYPQQDMTAAVYVEQMAQLPRQDLALVAVNSLIQHSHHLPKIAELVESYERERVRDRDRIPFGELEEGEWSEEEIAANMERLKALTDTIGESMSLEERLARIDS